MREILGYATWTLPSRVYEGHSDQSSVSVYWEDGKHWLELACNDVSRRLQIYPPVLRTLVVDSSRLDQDFRILADTDREVASVAERLGLRVLG